MNTFRTPEPEKQEKANKSFNLLKIFDPETYLKVQSVSKNLPFILFCSVLAMVYISNAHKVEKRIRSINKLETEIKDLRAEYITIKSDLMFQSKQSEVAKKVEVAGLREMRSAPKKLYLNR